MSFASIEFLCFLAGFFVLYHALADVRAQNVLIVAGSYVFYGWWDWRFLPLLFGISAANYAAALAIAGAKETRTRNAVLAAAVALSLGALAVFKYFDFFTASLAQAFAALGVTLSLPTLKIVLPLGISFMTFQGIAYVVDVWRGEHEAERDLVRFLGFKAFFPQLVAGPIERASNLLDQFRRPRSLDADKVARATWLLVYGFFLKVFVADGMAPIVDSLFVPNQPFGWSVVLATIAFGVQIYADFSGYSLIAKGAALLLGFDLIWNFRFPYWSVSISDFWRRWHISLSNWLRDYLYIPLGGNRHGSLATARNLLVTMGLGGLWHGASWNFVAWGLLHGVALAAWRFSGVGQSPESALGRALGWAATMLIVFTGWFLFRATSLELIAGMTRALGNWEWAPVHAAALRAVAAVSLPIALVEWWQLRRHDDYFLLSWRRWIAYPALSASIFLCLVAARQSQTSFIYFQF